MLRPAITAFALLLLLALPAVAADPADPLIAQGQAAMAARDFDKAIDLLKQAVARSRCPLLYYHGRVKQPHPNREARMK